MVICVFFNFKMRYNNINLLHFIFLLRQHFYLHSNAKLLILQTGFLHSFAAAFN